MRSVYVTGGRQRRRFLKKEQEWNLYERALILRIDVEKSQSEVCVDYISPPEACASDETPSFLFKSATLCGNTLYVCTSTEVLIYQIPEFKRIGYISLPCFNDLHHVSPKPDGNLLVVNTGLDMVVDVSLEGEVQRVWNVLGGDPWERFSPERDYRRVATTKPHASHPNHVLQLGDEIWVTRAAQGDCLNLTSPDRRIEIGGEYAHDGHAYGDKIYFTLVSGKLVIVDRRTLRRSEIIDLCTIDNDAKALLGWCRGVLVLDERWVWVAFTRVRKTRFAENINWVKHTFQQVDKPAHLALYDLVAKKCVKEIDLEELGMDVVFSILPSGVSNTRQE